MNLTHAVPIRVVGRAGTTPPPQMATFFRVTPDGAIEQELATVPIENGEAVFHGAPLPQGSRWAISVHEPGGLPIFRSGPLAQLPGPVSPVVPSSHISIFRSDGMGGFDIDAPDGLPELALQSLQHLPASLRAVRVDQVVFSADAAGHEIVKVIGRVRTFFFFWRPFTYARLVTLRPESHPGFPASIVLFDGGGPDIATGAPLGARAPALSAAIGGAILTQLNAALHQIASLQGEVFHVEFHADLVSATSLQVIPESTGPRLNFIVHGGTITPGLGDVVVAEQ